MPMKLDWMHCNISSFSSLKLGRYFNQFTLGILFGKTGMRVMFIGAYRTLVLASNSKAVYILRIFWNHWSLNNGVAMKNWSSRFFKRTRVTKWKVTTFLCPTVIHHQQSDLNFVVFEGDDKSLIPRQQRQDVSSWILATVVTTKGTQGNLQTNL